jgi:AhpD family alkylhydroperoxidase
MATLNKAAAEAMKEAGASACTDVTGFGLFAHLYRMMRPGKLGAEIFADALPAFDGVVEALRQGVIPGAVERNREYVGETIRVAPKVDEALINLGFDAQTSGGLLIAIPRERLETLRQALARRGAGGFVIGQIVGSSDAQILVIPSSPDASKIRGKKPGVHQPENKSMKPSASDSTHHHDGCCADMFKGEGAASSVGETQNAFGAMIRSVQAGGVLSEKAKELILFSLVVHSRCHPCFDAHFRRARELGLTRAELDEAAWCAIAMGGAPVKMFYQESMEKAQKMGGA